VDFIRRFSTRLAYHCRLKYVRFSLLEPKYFIKATVYHILTWVTLFLLYSVVKFKKIMKSILLKSQTNYGFYELILTLQTTDARDEIVKNVPVYSLFPKHQR
jgi:hypothetical protein